LRLDRLHINVCDLSGICRRAEINCLGAAGQGRLVLQTDESQARVGKQCACDADFVVGFIKGAEMPLAAFQNRFDCRIETVEQELTLVESIPRGIELALECFRYRCSVRFYPRNVVLVQVQARHLALLLLTYEGSPQKTLEALR
jgi:hypothetical protein